MKRNKRVRKKQVKFVDSERIVGAVGHGMADVLMKIEELGLVPAFTDSGCIGLNTCPIEVYNRYFHQMVEELNQVNQLKTIRETKSPSEGNSK